MENCPRHDLVKQLVYILGPLITECGSCGSADSGLPINRSSSASNDSTWISSRDPIACLGELSDHLISLRAKIEN